MKLLYIYLICINIVSFAMYGIDKWKAQNHRWRISESALIGAAVIGGALGAWLGMQTFRHKTNHSKFTIGVRVILLIQVIAAAYFVVKNGGGI